jgi:CheY-like chemotaxis protein
VELGEKGCKAILGFRDISSEVREDKKQQQILRDALAQAEYANRAKTVFLNNMSHDIRTPMNAIIGYTALASNHLDDKEHLKDYLSKISQSSNHLLSLINDVLDMSRIESGKMRLDEQPENILELIQSIRNIIQTDINTRKLELSIDMAEISDENIYCDKLKLNQILLNLLSNAMKFSKQGGTVYLKIRQNEDAPNGYGAYEFRVKDNGIGMSREFQAHIFEPFTREHTSTVTGIQGTGLGMSITKNIVDMMGGTISVTSERGKGTEFVVKLNLKLKNTPGDSGSESCSNTDKTSDDSVTDFTGTRILLAEDNELNTEIAIELLSEYGFVIETAPNGRIACDKLATSKPGYYDLILMDIQMPIMDGYEAAVNIRAMKEKKFSCIPIIAMTANAFAEDRDKALKCGMNAHVAKPINMKNLLKTIQQVLKSADYN